jgi:hypothetical protein
MGWYLQQFSKLLIPMVVPDLSKHYLAIDGDLVFTRPYHFTTTDGKKNLIMPTTSKLPKHWRYFVDWIFDWKNDTNDKENFVVGWMPLDQTIVKDLIVAMNQNIPGPDAFPFNSLNQAEQVINQTFFSEFYVYTRYALRHSSNPYVLRNIKEPARNPGKFQWTCVLRQSTYEKARTDRKLAPFFIERNTSSMPSMPVRMTSPSRRLHFRILAFGTTFTHLRGAVTINFYWPCDLAWKTWS